MATTAAQKDKEIRDEFNELKAQVGDLLAAIKDRGEVSKESLGSKIEKGAEHYQKRAEDTFDDLYDNGMEAIDEVGARIRANPLTSILLAFGTGYLISKIIDK